MKLFKVCLRNWKLKMNHGWLALDWRRCFPQHRVRRDGQVQPQWDQGGRSMQRTVLKEPVPMKSELWRQVWDCWYSEKKNLETVEVRPLLSNEEPVQRDRTVIVMMEQVEIAEGTGDKLDTDMIHVLKEGVVVQLEHGRLNPRSLFFKARPDRKIFLTISRPLVKKCTCIFKFSCL